MSCNTPPFRGVGRSGKAMIEATIKIAERGLETTTYNLELFCTHGAVEKPLGEMAFSGANAKRAQLALRRMVDDYLFLQTTLYDMVISIGETFDGNARSDLG